MARELLFSITKKDLKIDYFSGTGAGGQHRNKHQNCVRIHHPESGAIATGQSSRKRQDNVKQALNGLIKHAKFKVWHARKVQEVLGGKTIEQMVDEQMTPNNISIDIKGEHGQWIPEGEIDGDE